MSLIVVGSANMDLVVRTPRFPAPGETLIGRSFGTAPGGKGANQAVAAARLGGEVEFIGCVGSDGFGEELRRSLESAGVGTEGLATRETQSTGIASITIDDAGQNTIVVAPGANASLSAGDAIRALDAKPGSTLLIQLEVPIEVVEEVVRSGKASLVVLNPAPANRLSEDLYCRIDVITPNETEASLLTGIPVEGPESAFQAAEALLKLGVRHAIVTLGSKGCCYVTQGVREHYPAFSVKAIDTVAAGDAFSGALALFLSQGRPMDEAIQIASVAAALSTTRRGAQESMPSLAEVNEAMG